MDTYTADLSDLGAAPAVPRAAKPAPVTVTQAVGPLERCAMLAVAFGAVAVTWVVAVRAIHDPGFDLAAPPGTPVEGLTIFAVFFVAAAGLERLLEPVATALAARPAKDASAVVERSTAAASTVAESTTAVGQKQEMLAAELEKVAAAKANVGRWGEWITVMTWALASSLGILAASSLKLYLLRRVGIAAPPRSLDILATGLIIGAGTKPLHDLTKLIEKKKETAAAAPTP